MSILKTTFRFLKHQFTAHTRYSIHSPFVYEFVTKVLPHRNSSIGEKIEQLHRMQAKSDQILQIEDFGAGYGGNERPMIEKKLKEVVKGSARGRREGELLKRITEHYKPANMLEFGANIGYSGMYLTSGNPEGKLLSVEGAKSLSEIARENHGNIGSSATIITSRFEDFLENHSFAEPVDLFFLDGNHRYEPTVRYVSSMLSLMADGGIIMLDDIRWSPEMEAAWSEIISWDEINVSLDLFFTGICFVRRPQVKEHFRLRFRPF